MKNVFLQFETCERINRIHELQMYGGGKMAQLKTSVGDYRDVEILPDSIIYMDIPYKGTKDYGMNFDYESFYTWCEQQTELVFISEYWMPEDRFVCIAEFPRRSTFSTTNNSKREIEKIFVPRTQYEKYKRKISEVKRNMGVQLDLFNERATEPSYDGSE